jgi:hypothetical protein
MPSKLTTQSSSILVRSLSCLIFAVHSPIFLFNLQALPIRKTFTTNRFRSSSLAYCDQTSVVAQRRHHLYQKQKYPKIVRFSFLQRITGEDNYIQWQSHKGMWLMYLIPFSNQSGTHTLLGNISKLDCRDERYALTQT